MIAFSVSILGQHTSAESEPTMSSETILVVGASGHGRVVVDALFQCGVPPEQIIVSDDSAALLGTEFLGLRVNVPAFHRAACKLRFHVAVGNSIARKRLFDELQNAGYEPFTVVHPKAIISKFSSIGDGAFLAAGGLIAPGAKVGKGTIINHAAIIDHDCVVGDFSHIAPNATLGGGARIGDHVSIGAGATILPQIHVGNSAVIGAGAVVLRDVAPGVICAGVPAVQIGVNSA